MLRQHAGPTTRSKIPKQDVFSSTTSRLLNPKKSKAQIPPPPTFFLLRLHSIFKSQSMAATIGTARAIFCEFQQQQKSPVLKRESAVPRLKPGDSVPEGARIVLQPRVCTLRSYGSGGEGVVRTRRGADATRFMASLSEYIENSKKSQDMETISGRLAMIAFAGALTMEIVTGNSLFGKMDLQGIAQGGGACLGAIVFAAAFAWFSRNRTRVGRIFNAGCNTFVDSLIDNIIDGLFYETGLSDWSDEV